jgi:hypothetical protein
MSAVLHTVANGITDTCAHVCSLSAPHSSHDCTDGESLGESDSCADCFSYCANSRSDSDSECCAHNRQSNGCTIGRSNDRANPALQRSTRPARVQQLSSQLQRCLCHCVPWTLPGVLHIFSYGVSNPHSYRSSLGRPDDGLRRGQWQWIRRV